MVSFHKEEKQAVGFLQDLCCLTFINYLERKMNSEMAKFVNDTILFRKVKNKAD